MTTIGNQSRPAYVYDSETDTWVPIGVGPHSHDEYIDKTVITAKGDIIVGTANEAVTKLGAGAAGTFLAVDSSSPTGLSWQDPLPSQASQTGKYLTTDGTETSWATIDALPSQTSQSGKYLTTDGTDASWATIDALPSQDGQTGKYLTTDGTDASWSTITTDPNPQIFLMMGA
jgi:hypothetical protein